MRISIQTSAHQANIMTMLPLFLALIARLHAASADTPAQMCVLGASQAIPTLKQPIPAFRTRSLLHVLLAQLQIMS